MSLIMVLEKLSKVPVTPGTGLCRRLVHGVDHFGYVVSFALVGHHDKVGVVVPLLGYGDLPGVNPVNKGAGARGPKCCGVEGPREGLGEIAKARS
jgi:hypothetical protein